LGAPENPESPLGYSRQASRDSKAASWNDAGLNMTIPPDMRDLTRSLLAYEAKADESTGPSESATLRVYDKLRHNLSVFAGVAGFQSLATRALVIARPDAPGLGAVRVSDDGTLRALGGSEPQVKKNSQIETNMVRSGIDLPGEAGTILIARLLGLLLIFLGEALTLSLLRVTWPGVDLNDSNSENGRKA
jgi:hypothetical protein